MRRLAAAIEHVKRGIRSQHPLCGRMSGDVKMDDPSTVMRKDEEDEQDFEPNRMHGEEVY